MPDAADSPGDPAAAAAPTVPVHRTSEAGPPPVGAEIVLDVECGPNRAVLYLTRLCQGSKGPCVLLGNTWLTPNQLQYVSGRETAKDWKRSIRHHGKSLKLLMAKGVLTLQPPVCRCEYCTGQKVDGDETDISAQKLKADLTIPCLKKSTLSIDSILKSEARPLSENLSSCSSGLSPAASDKENTPLCSGVPSPDSPVITSSGDGSSAKTATANHKVFAPTTWPPTVRCDRSENRKRRKEKDFAKNNEGKSREVTPDDSSPSLPWWLRPNPLYAGYNSLYPYAYAGYPSALSYSLPYAAAAAGLSTTNLSAPSPHAAAAVVAAATLSPDSKRKLVDDSVVDLSVKKHRSSDHDPCITPLSPLLSAVTCPISSPVMTTSLSPTMTSLSPSMTSLGSARSPTMTSLSPTMTSLSPTMSSLSPTMGSLGSSQPIKPVPTMMEPSRAYMQFSELYHSGALSAYYRSLGALSAPSEDAVSLWSVDRTVDFVTNSEQCSEYSSIFREQSIDGRALALLSVEHMTRGLGMKLGPAVYLRDAVDRLMGLRPSSSCSLSTESKSRRS